MIDEEDRIGPGEAREALHAIREAERAGLGRAIPPRWFGVVIALITGALLASTAAERSGNVALLILALAGVLEFRRRKLGASPRSFPSTPMGFLALFGILAFFLLLIGAARILVEGYGLAWAPLAAGALIAILVYVLSVFERREYFAKIDIGKNQ